MSNRRFKKGTFLKKVRFYFFIKRFLHTFCQKRTFCYSTTFIESLITHKRFIFKESYISYGKRQKSCTSIVVKVKCLYLTSPIFNSSSKSTGFFFWRRGSIYIYRTHQYNTTPKRSFGQDIENESSKERETVLIEQINRPIDHVISDFQGALYRETAAFLKKKAPLPPPPLPAGDRRRNGSLGGEDEHFRNPLKRKKMCRTLSPENYVRLANALTLKCVSLFYAEKNKACRVLTEHNDLMIKFPLFLSLPRTRQIEDYWGKKPFRILIPINKLFSLFSIAASTCV